MNPKRSLKFIQNDDKSWVILGTKESLRDLAWALESKSSAPDDVAIALIGHGDRVRIEVPGKGDWKTEEAKAAEHKVWRETCIG